MAEVETPEDGHTFRFVFDIRPSSKVTGDAEWTDGPTFMGPAHVIEARGWSLNEALRKVLDLPLAVKMATIWNDGADLRDRADTAFLVGARYGRDAALAEAREKVDALPTTRTQAFDKGWDSVSLEDVRAILVQVMDREESRG